MLQYFLGKHCVRDDKPSTPLLVTHFLSHFAAIFCAIILPICILFETEKSIILFFSIYLFIWSAIPLLVLIHADTLAKCILFIALICGMFDASLLLGIESRVHFMFLILTCLPIFLFPQKTQKDRFLRYCSLFLAYTAFFLFELKAHDWYTPLALSANAYVVIKILLMSSAFIAMALIISLFANKSEEKQMIKNLLDTELLLNQNLKKQSAELEVAKNKAEKANHSKSVFLATMSHELRTPLNGILGSAQILESHLSDSAEKESLGIIREAGHLLLRHVNNLLELSELETGDARLVIEEVRLDSFIEECIKLIKPQLLERHKELEIHLPTQNWFIQTDVRLSRLLLTHLLENALKFTPKKAHITITPTSEGTLSVVVKDDGPGIPKHLRERLFQDIAQADGSYSRRVEGLGVGLRICSLISEHLDLGLHADVVQTTEKRSGAQFTFTLQGCEIENEYAKNLQSLLVHDTHAIIENDENVTDGGIHVLLAEDIVMNQKVATKILQNMGCDVDLAENGLIAYEMAQKKLYQVILMDLQMPEMDGFESTEKIRASSGLSASAPIIALTANTSSADRDRCALVGMDDFMSKPIKKDELAMILKQFSNAQWG